jgi:molybdopterin-guanine dinucleotide biosynthesis protein A
LPTIPRLSGFIEPLAAFYPKSAHALAEAQLRNFHHAVTSFAESCMQSGLGNFYDLSTKDADYFANLNTPMDATALSSEQVQVLPNAPFIINGLHLFFGFHKN